MRGRRIALALAAALLAVPAVADDALVLYGAGSLREAMMEVAAAFSARPGAPAVRAAFGFSGLMRERIERGERADLFASADMGHPERLLREGRAVAVAPFARNSLCVVAPPRAGLTGANLLDRLLDPSLVLGIFPPVQDPVGDYSLALFDRADAVRPGAGAALRVKAVVIAEAMARPPFPGGDWAAALLRDGTMAIHVSYCTTARNRLRRALPDLDVVELPDALRVGPLYGLATLAGAHRGAADLAAFVLGPEGQGILGRHGFSAVESALRE